MSRYSILSVPLFAALSLYALSGLFTGCSDGGTVFSPGTYDHGDLEGASGSTDISVDGDGGGDDAVPDVADDGPADLPEGSCVADRDCGDTTCADGSFRCNAGRCEALPPMICPEDGVRCTRNYCSVTSPTTSACVRQAASSWCPAGWTCDQDDGCIRPDRSCSSDGACDDGVECTEDRCVPGRGVCGNDPVDAEDTLLYQPDYGVPDSSQNPFRVIRFTNDVGVALERGTGSGRNPARRSPAGTAGCPRRRSGR